MELRDGDVVLRPWRLDDAPALTAALQDPKIPRWIPMIPFGYSEDDAREFLHRSLERAAKAEGYDFAILETETGALLGSIGMNLAARMGVGHIGYWVASEARGRGIATRAVRRLRAYGFEELALAPAGAHDRSREWGVTACRGEGRLPSRRCAAVAALLPGWAEGRQHRVLAASRRAAVGA